MSKPVDEVIKRMLGRVESNLIDRYDAVELLTWLQYLRHVSAEAVNQLQQKNESIASALVHSEAAENRLREQLFSHPAPRSPDQDTNDELLPTLSAFDPDQAVRRTLPSAE